MNDVHRSTVVEHLQLAHEQAVTRAACASSITRRLPNCKNDFLFFCSKHFVSVVFAFVYMFLPDMVCANDEVSQETTVVSSINPPPTERLEESSTTITQIDNNNNELEKLPLKNSRNPNGTAASGEMATLGRIMYREGPEFSQTKYNHYVARLVTGVVFLSGAGISVGLTIYYLVKMLGVGSNCPAEEQDDCSDANKKKTREYKTGLFVSLFAIPTSVAIGVPLVINGSKGRKRQIFLRDNKQRIEEEYCLKLTVGFSSDSYTTAFLVSCVF